MTCGLPSGLTVASQAVCRSGPPVFGAWEIPFCRRFCTFSHGIMGAPYPSRFRFEIGSFNLDHDSSQCSMNLSERRTKLEKRVLSELRGQLLQAWEKYASTFQARKVA